MSTSSTLPTQTLLSPPILRRPRRPITDSDPRPIIQIETDRLATGKRPSADNALRRICDSISRFGIMHPLTVRIDTTSPQVRFLVVDGAKRLYAAQILELHSLPCVLENHKESADFVEQIKLLDGMPFAQAKAISDMIALCGLTQQEAAQRLSMSQSTVANKLRLLRLSADERERISSLSLSERHARAIVSLTPEQRSTALSRIEQGKLNVAETEAYIDTLRTPSISPASKQKAAIRDIGLFYNSINRAISILHGIGISASLDRREEEENIVLTITVCRPHVSRETKSQV